MRKAGAKDYKAYSKKILEICNNKPVSLEVFADEYEEMKKQATEASGILKAIANETRLLILCSIIEDDFTVNQLSEITGTAQSSVSQHLKVLSEQNIVSSKRIGKKIIYKITDTRVKAILVLMHALFCK